MCKCGKSNAPSKRYCAGCHAAYMRDWRSRNPLTPAQRLKDNARSTANVAQKRGRLIPAPCEICGSAETEKHHDDYDKPLDVRWLCRPHHLELHQCALKS
jgi:hypothetical protein